MTKLYIAFYDDEDGWDRESWNTFYTPWVASTVSRADAEQKARAAIQAEIAESIKDQFNVDITQVNDESTLSEEIREELECERQRAKDKHIEIQEGEL